MFLIFFLFFILKKTAKAIYDNKLLECYFTRSFYKHILGISVKYTDMESEDYSFYRGLVYLMENNINDLGCDLTFSTEINEFGVTETRDLIPNGRNVPVTEENKMEYVRRSCQMKMTGAIRQQCVFFIDILIDFGVSTIYFFLLSFSIKPNDLSQGRNLCLNKSPPTPPYCPKKFSPTPPYYLKKIFANPTLLP